MAIPVMRPAKAATPAMRRYEENDTPWDKGAPAPALTTFLHEKQIAGRVLVPGRGRGHDVRALGTQPNTSVAGLDISATVRGNENSQY